MPDKLVFVKELKTGQSEKNNSTWPEILDQDGEIWRLFRQQIKPELGKAYLVSFILNEKGFKDIEKITPVVNIFHQKALAETANRNDYIRQYNTCLGMSKDLVVAGKIDMVEIYVNAILFYDWVEHMTDEKMSKINPNKEELR